MERAKISVADRLRVVLQATAPESDDVELPERADKLGEFTVADFRSAQPKLVGEGRVLYERSYVLEPFLAGEYKVPPLTVYYGEKKAQAAEREQIVTEEVPIEVASVLPPEEKQPQIKEIADPVDMPAAWWPWRLAAQDWRRRWPRSSGGIAGAAPRQERIPPLKPHEVAYRELEALLASGLLEKGGREAVLSETVERAAALH